MGAWKQAIIKILGHLFELDQKKMAKICFWRNIDVYCVFFFKDLNKTVSLNQELDYFHL